MHYRRQYVRGFVSSCSEEIFVYYRRSMDLSLFQYRWPIWTFPSLGWEIPFVLALFITFFFLFLREKFIARYALSVHAWEYRRRIESLSLDDPLFISDLSLLLRSYFDTYWPIRWRLVATGREWRMKERDRTLERMSMLLDSFEYAKDPTREEKEKMREEALRIVFSRT